MVDGVSGPARLHLPPERQRELAAGLEEAYPGEGCGVLLGDVDGRERRVTRLVAAENRWSRRDDRYLVDPGTLRRLMDEEEGGNRILGFYHSHPDADPVPSETDRELAWPWYLYLIVPVRDGRAGWGRVWELEAPDGPFAERPLVRSGSASDATNLGPPSEYDGAGTHT